MKSKYRYVDWTSCQLLAPDATTRAGPSVIDGWPVDVDSCGDVAY